MKLLNLFLSSLIILSCSSEENGSEINETTEPVLTASNFSPNSEGSYWKYDVDSSSTDLPENGFYLNRFIVCSLNVKYNLHP